ncbi:hypothetical protein JBE27_34730, partial [Streptomyces albiflaviniger]|nr:hypothetical protein [Streptomyces albiflaviniger]
MSPTSLVLLLAAVTATAVGAAALHTARGVRRQISELRAELAATVAAGARAGGGGGGGEEGGPTVPAPRATPAAEIRAAVADALAEERERELAEARAFWAAQEARDSTGAADAHSLLSGPGGFEDASQDAQLFVPRQADLAGLEPLLGLDALGPDAMDSNGDQEPEVESEVELELGAGAEPAAEPR